MKNTESPVLQHYLRLHSAIPYSPSHRLTYFLEKECVRIRISSNETFAHTSRGIYSGNSYSQMVDQYGDSYEKHTYMGKERYTIYRYALGECFHEFGIPGEATGEIYNVDVYVSGQMPIYDYGEEIVED